MSEIILMGRPITVAAQPWTVAVDIGPRVLSALTNPRALAQAPVEAYEMLCELAPDVRAAIPAHVFCAFLSAEEMAASDKSHGTGPAPTLPEIIQAFKTALAVNGADDIQSLTSMVAGQFAKVLPGLGKLVPMLVDEDAQKAVREFISVQVQLAMRTAARAQAQMLTPSSSPSPSTNGTSPSTSGSAESPPTADTNAAGPFPASIVPLPAGTPSG